MSTEASLQYEAATGLVDQKNAEDGQEEMEVSLVK
jgi:hypothetical protein